MLTLGYFQTCQLLQHVYFSTVNNTHYWCCFDIRQSKQSQIVFGLSTIPCGSANECYIGETEFSCSTSFWSTNACCSFSKLRNSSPQFLCLAQFWDETARPEIRPVPILMQYFFNNDRWFSFHQYEKRNNTQNCTVNMHLHHLIVDNYFPIIFRDNLMNPRQHCNRNLILLNLKRIRAGSAKKQIKLYDGGGDSRNSTATHPVFEILWKFLNFANFLTCQIAIPVASG